MSLAERFWFAKYRPTTGDVIVDIGAGVGEDLQDYIAAVGPSGKIVMVESDPTSFRSLVEAAAGLPNVVCSRVAAVDTEREMWCVAGRNYEENSVSSDRTEDSYGRVDGVPMDIHLLRRLGLARIDLLKMNIEGAERLALKGMAETLKISSHAVICAHDFRAIRGEGEHFRTGAEVIAAMRAAGFVTEVTPGWDHVHGYRS